MPRGTSVPGDCCACGLLVQATDRPLLRLGQDIRLDNRWVDLRTPANNAIMRLRSGVCQLFRCGRHEFRWAVRGGFLGRWPGVGRGGCA